MRIVATLLLATLASAAIFEDVLSGSTLLNFLGRFCFDAGIDGNSSGYYQATLTFDETHASNFIKDDGLPSLRILEYSDQEKSWPSIYDKESLTCLEVITASKACEKRLEKRLECTGWESWLSPVDFKKSGKTYSDTSKVGITQNFNRWWYVAVINCKEDGTHQSMEGLSYKTEFLNTQRASWSEQLGYDVMGLNTFYLAMFFIFLVFFCVHMYGVYNLSSKLEYLHPMIKLFAIDLTLQFVAIIFYMLHWGIYSSNGVGLNALRQAGEVVDAITRVLFMLILTLMAKGWTISGDELTGKKLIIGTLLLFLLIHSAILLYKYQLEDPAAVFMATGLQVILWFELALWFLFACFFSFTVFKSWKKEDNPVKRMLFLQLGVVFTLWFFLYPTLNLVDLSRNSDRGWVTSSAKVMNESTLCVSMAGYAFLSFLLWPSRAEEYFHINKPDVMRANIDTYEQL